MRVLRFLVLFVGTKRTDINPETHLLIELKSNTGSYIFEITPLNHSSLLFINQKLDSVSQISV
jgi:hypothetical protein